MEGSKENNEFEKLWAERFANAEMEPGDHVWNNISGALADGQVGTYKRRLVYYRWAAAILLLITLGLGVLYIGQLGTVGSEEQLLATNIDQSTTEAKDQNKKGNSTSNGHLADNELAGTDNANVGSSSIDSTDGDVGSSLVLSEDNNNNLKNSDTRPTLTALADYQQSSSRITPQENDVINADPESSQNLLVSDFSSLSNKLESQQQSLLELMSAPEHIYAVPIYANAIVPDKDESNSKLWAGFNIGSGSFDPNYGAPTGNVDEAALVAEDAFTADFRTNNAGLSLQEQSSPGPTIAFGVDVGKSVGEKWVLQSGVRYGRYRVNSETNLVFSTGNEQFAPLSFQNRDALFFEDEVTVSNESVQVNNNFQLLSIPMKAGFLLLDRQFNILLNAGFSGDIYLGNDLDTRDDDFNTYEISPGASSPYRRVHFNGLTSIQFGYRIQENYF